MTSPFDMSNPYHVRVARWADDGSLVTATEAIKKEVAHKLKTVDPPIEVRLAAIEGFIVELARLVVMATLSNEGDVDKTLNVASYSVEFMRLDALLEAIELYELQKGSTD